MKQRTIPIRVTWPTRIPPRERALTQALRETLEWVPPRRCRSGPGSERYQCQAWECRRRGPSPGEILHTAACWYGRAVGLVNQR